MRYEQSNLARVYVRFEDDPEVRDARRIGHKNWRFAQALLARDRLLLSKTSVLKAV